ncbi:MAG TPA: signal peptidase II [Bacteroidota bacterium]|nr:signal peptidase II [Bacteroidota bacterium]
MRVLYITLIVVLVDQISKLLIKGFNIPFLGIYHHGMELNTTFEVIDDFVRFTFVENPGMAFGLDFGGKLFFSIFSIIASIGILYYLYKVRFDKLLLRIPLALILGGAIGNLIDRVFYGVLYGDAPLFYGKVVDFIDMKFFRMEFFGYRLTRWPVFNVSDIAVTVGVLILLLFHKKITENSYIGERILKVPVPELKSSKDFFASK